MVTAQFLISRLLMIFSILWIGGTHSSEEGELSFPVLSEPRDLFADLGFPRHQENAPSYDTIDVFDLENDDLGKYCFRSTDIQTTTYQRVDDLGYLSREFKTGKEQKICAVGGVDGLSPVGFIMKDLVASTEEIMKETNSSGETELFKRAMDKFKSRADEQLLRFDGLFPGSVPKFSGKSCEELSQMSFDSSSVELPEELNFSQTQFLAEQVRASLISEGLHQKMNEKILDFKKYEEDREKETEKLTEVCKGERSITLGNQKLVIPRDLSFEEAARQYPILKEFNLDERTYLTLTRDPSYPWTYPEPISPEFIDTEPEPNASEFEEMSQRCGRQKYEAEKGRVFNSYLESSTSLMAGMKSHPLLFDLGEREDNRMTNSEIKRSGLHDYLLGKMRENPNFANDINVITDYISIDESGRQDELNEGIDLIYQFNKDHINGFLSEGRKDQALRDLMKAQIASYSEQLLKGLKSTCENPEILMENRELIAETIRESSGSDEFLELQGGFCAMMNRYKENNQGRELRSRFLQNGGMALTTVGFGLDLTGVGAVVGVPLQLIGSGAFMLDSYLNAEYEEGRFQSRFALSAVGDQDLSGALDARVASQGHQDNLVLEAALSVFAVGGTAAAKGGGAILGRVVKNCASRVSATCQRALSAAESFSNSRAGTFVLGSSALDSAALTKYQRIREELIERTGDVAKVLSVEEVADLYTYAETSPEFLDLLEGEGGAFLLKKFLKGLSDNGLARQEFFQKLRLASGGSCFVP